MFNLGYNSRPHTVQASVVSCHSSLDMWETIGPT